MNAKLFIALYEVELIARYSWAKQDKAKLARFLASVEATIAGEATTWECCECGVACAR